MTSKVMCDKCEKQFSVKIKQLYYIERDKVVVEGYICPHCNSEYITLVTNNELREGMYRAKELHDKINEVNRRKKREYQSYMEDIGKVPSRIATRYAEELNKLQHEYRVVCQQNQAMEKVLKEKYL